MIEFGADWKHPVYLGFTLDLKIFFLLFDIFMSL